ncbi:MAG: two-component SAPR family response regulator [Spirosomataceae bacterium]|jgi:two-component SAPR family response regulator
MKKVTLSILLLLLTCANIAVGQTSLDSGLYFSSHETTKEKRTSLSLTPNDPIKLEDKLTIEFDANFRRGDGHFGNIVRIVGDEHLNIQIVANLISEEENFWLTVQDQILIKYRWPDISKGGFEKWMKFTLEIDARKSEITMSVNGKKISKQSNELKDISKLDIVFGKSLLHKFSTTDVCPMSIRHVKILGNDNKPLRNWPLGKHTKTTTVYDEITNDIAVVENPKWLIDQHIFWKKNKNFKFSKLLGIAQDETAERIFFIDTKTVYVYSIKADSMVTFNYQKGSLNCQSNNFIYNSLKNELIVYSLDENFYSKFDFKKQAWENSDSVCDETNYLHHNRMVSPQDSTVLTFGGYGQYQYKSQVYKFNTNERKFYNLSLQKIVHPRYLSSSGIVDAGNFLIFGGNGSHSGKQGVNNQFYYDLYSVEFGNLKATKLWNAKELAEQSFVPVRSMVIDKDSDSFYTLIYNSTNFNTYLRLARFGISSFSMTVYPDSIPYHFLDIKSEADFFLNGDKTRLYTITKSENEVSLYSLTYPPLVSSEIYQRENTAEFALNYYWLLFVAAGVLIFYIYKLKRNQANKLKNEKLNEEALQTIITKAEKVNISAIHLFGGFQVYNADGNDITAQFTPTIKELFLLILLSSIKNDKGISSKKLIEVLWPNKSDSNARNNKNVNISKLRLLLEKIGDIHLSNDNTYWQIKWGNTVYCDYAEVSKFTNRSTHETLEKEQVYKLLSIFSHGVLLLDVETEWIENFQNEASNSLVDDLERISKSQRDHHVQVTISKSILTYDPLNEQAIAVQCKSLYSLGKKRQAKESYDQFCQEYEEVLDVKFDKAFVEIVS